MQIFLKCAAVLGVAAGVCSAQVQLRGALATPDDSVVAREAMPRVRELTAAGNTALALSVLQDLLDKESEHLLPSPRDPELFYPVRRHLHDLLLADPELLGLYRQTQGAAARRLLDAGELEELERTRLLTAAGFEGELRLAQLKMESGRFEAARLALEELEQHPDRAPGSKGARDAAGLAAQVAWYIGRDDVTRWAQRWASEAGVSPTHPAPLPPGAFTPGENAVTGFATAPDPHGPTEALQAVRIGDEKAWRGLSRRESGSRVDAARWILPTVADSLVLVNDGVHVSAFDAATLSPVWDFRPMPPGASVADLIAEVNVARPNELEDVNTVSVAGGVAVAATGVPTNGTRVGDGRIHALELSTGRPLWSVDPASLDPRLSTLGAAVRGPIVIDQGTAVVSVRRQGLQRRETQLMLAGLDLYTGRTKWVRPVASVGTLPWARGVARADGAVASRGVVYRGDDMGVLGAFEADTGRALWVRVLASRSFADPIIRGAGELIPRDMSTPVVIGEDLFYLEGAVARVRRVSARDGTQRGVRDARDLGQPRYILGAGGTLACVCSERVGFISPAEFDKGSARFTAELGSRSPDADEVIVGRAAWTDSLLTAPVAGGVALVDPAHPETPALAPLDSSGNIAVGSVQGSANLLTASGDSLATYVSWARAQELLTRRAAAAPEDPGPLLTHVELAFRGGHAALAPGLADRVLALAEAHPLAPGSAPSRQRLFELLAGEVAESRRAWGDPNAERRAFAPRPVADTALLDQLIDRMGRAAEGVAQQAQQWLEQAWLCEVSDKPTRAVEAYQRLIADDSFRPITLASAQRAAGLAPDPGEDQLVSQIASSRLLALLSRVGPGAYQAFDEEAQAGVAALPPGAGVDEIERLARRYPAATVTPDLWLRAGEVLLARAEDARARLAFGSGLSAAEASVRIGRAERTPQIARLAGALAGMSDRPGMMEPVYRMLRRLGAQYPGVGVATAAGTVPAQRLADALRARLDERPLLPGISVTLGPGVQTLETWSPVEPLMPAAPGATHDTALFISEVYRRASLLGVSVEDATLRELWTRPFETPPLVLRASADATLLYWTTPTGARIEAIDNVSGTTLWQSPDTAELFQRSARPEEVNQIQTPLDGRVRASDIMLAADANTMVVAQRNARAAAFDIRTGTRLWVGSLDLDALFEMEVCGTHLVAGGATGLSVGKAQPALHFFDLATGHRVSTLPAASIGDHPRWIRSAPNGDALIGTSDSVLRVEPASAKVLWSTDKPQLARTSTGWIAGDDLYVLDSDEAVWQIDVNSGTPSAGALDSRGRVSLPARGVVTGDTLAITGPGGVLIYRDARLIGANAPRTFVRSLPAAAAEGYFVTAEALDDAIDQPGDFTMVRLLLLSADSGKIATSVRVRVPESPQGVGVLEGKILLSTGSTTVVVDAAK